ncbi:MAG TPA: hypothetical protein VG144_01110 [Gaiellaceae bacterium]|nr:hypothetical protein [Gaiellaceae bacterium]
MDLAGLAARYAPLVVLHDADRLRPASAGWFVERSRLRWATGVGLDGVPVAGAEDAVDETRLGAASADPYSHEGYLASALTRPLDDHSARRGDPPLERGFFVRLAEEAHARGAASTSPDPSVYAGATVYWDYEETARAMTYWLFYPGSSPPLGILRAGEQIGMRTRAAGGRPDEGAEPDEIEAAMAAAALEEFQRAYPGLAAEAEPDARTRGLTDVVQRLRVVAEGVRALLRDDDVLHEGDWERVTVYLDQSDPENAPPASVVFYRHSTNTPRRWADVDKEGEHPVAYCAIGSHASLPSPDYGFIDVGDRDGPRWRTWDEIAPIAEQPWYGFGGAWGRVGKVRDSTGPLGPGAHWKHAAPRPAL